MDHQAVRDLFEKLKNDSESFFERVADDVDWIVEGTHPLAGHYKGKQDFLDHTFAKLAEVLPNGAQLTVVAVMVDGDWAAIELHSDVLAKNGMRFHNRYCWVCRFRDDVIVEVRAYLDSAMVEKLFRENPI